MAANPVVKLTATLFDLFANRQIEQGKRLIDKHLVILSAAKATGDRGVPELFRVLTHWAEYSKRALAITQRLDIDYEQDRGDYSRKVWCLVSLGKANLAFQATLDSQVKKHCDWVLSNVEECFDAKPLAEIQASAKYTLARSLKRGADIPEAQRLVREAQVGFKEAGLELRSTVASVLDGWLLLQLGKHAEAKATWDTAEAKLTSRNSDDWTVLANLKFYRARQSLHAGSDGGGRALLLEAVALYEKSEPPHRNLRRTLLELVNVEVRIATTGPADAAELRNSANEHWERAKTLLDADDSDAHNHVRLLLTRANMLLSANPASLRNARSDAKKAHRIAEERGNLLMKSRASWMQAVIERLAIFGEDEMPPQSRLVLAFHFSWHALTEAHGLNNARLLARIHTLRGNLFLERLLGDIQKASNECEAAETLMESHEGDQDYVVQEIRALRARLGQFAKAQSK